jgi:hypothetical protein
VICDEIKKRHGNFVMDQRIFCSVRNRTIKYVKILWTNQSEREATWELEDSMREEYPELFETGKQYLYTYGSFLVLSLATMNSGTNSFKEGRM